MALSLSAWTHHHLLKATSPVKFNQGRLERGAANKQAKDALREITRARESYLEQVGNSASSPEVVVRAADEYVALLLGILNPPQSTTGPNEYAPQYPVTGSNDIPTGETNTALGPGGRARTAILYQWRDVLTGKIVIFEDAQAELICTLLNVGLWHCMYASKMQNSAAPDDEQAAKDIYHAMRVAASYFDHVANSQLDKFTYQQIPGSAPPEDLDARIVLCMAEQCLAEAQEVTATRARMKGHLPAVVAGIALNERDRFIEAKKHLTAVDKALIEDLLGYFDFKIDYYDAMTLFYNGEHLFKEEKCGDALRCYDEAQKKIARATTLATEYMKRRKKRKSLKKSTDKEVTETEAFEFLDKAIRTSYTKAKHEHSFIYASQRVPVELPELLPTKSLVQKEVYQLPERSSVWNDASLIESKIPARGTDRGADLASSDFAKVKSGSHHAAGVEESMCSVQ